MQPDPEALLQQAQSLERQGRPGEAIAAYRQLLTVRADLPDAWFNLAVLFRGTGELAAALACYQHALNRGVAEPEGAHLNRAVIYSDCLHQYDVAEQELTRALTLNPTYVPALLNLANLCEDQGRKEEALAAYETILRLQPEHIDALARYAAMKSFESPADPLIGQLRDRIRAPGLRDADRATLGFSLGRALDSCGAYAEAFQVYTAANRHSRASAPPGTGRYDRAAMERLVEQLMAAFPAGEPAAAEGAGPNLTAGSSAVRVAPGEIGGPAAGSLAAGGPDVGSADKRPHALLAPRPLFICGMFRSGSTLIEQLITSHSNIIAGGEIEFLPNLVRTVLAPYPDSLAAMAPAQTSSLAMQYLQALATRFPNAPCVTDKRPDNFLHIGLIKQLFPEARIVHTLRDPLDNCLSIFFLHLDQRMSYALDLEDTGHYYVQYRRLMQHWKRLYGPDIHDIDYGSYVRQPETQALRLFEFLGIDAQPEVSRRPLGAVRTASVWQVREPLYQHSCGRAGNYARELAALRDYLDR